MRQRMLMICGAVVVGGILAGYARMERPLGERAMEAYASKDYAKAVVLLRQLAGTPEVMGDRERLRDVMAYVVDAELRSAGQVEGISLPAEMRAKEGADLAALRAQAELVAKEAMARIAGASQGGRTAHLPLANGEVRDMTIKELGNFTFDPMVDAAVPADVKGLSGGRLRLHGYMTPLTQADHVTDFALVPSLVMCCTYGQPPGVEHIVTCRVARSKALEYTTEELVVEGVLKVDVKRESGYTNSIFEMDVDSVKLAE